MEGGRFYKKCDVLKVMSEVRVQEWRDDNGGSGFSRDCLTRLVRNAAETEISCIPLRPV